MDKREALVTALKQIEKDFGKGAVMRLGDVDDTISVEVVPTDIIPLDEAMGIGGLPRGRIIEVYGPESSGKTTVALHMIASAQRHGGIAAFIDAEHALDSMYARNLGVDTDNLVVSQPDNGEQALDIVEHLVRSGAIDIIVVDSVAALVPKEEIEGDMGDSHVGLHARLMSQAMRKLTGFISKSRTIVVFINQIREKVGVIYGNPETTTGGRALKFYASIRLEVRKGEPIKQGSEIIGNRTKVKVVKNKVAPPFRICEFDLIYGEGISRESCLIDMASDLGIINKAGSWYSFRSNRLGQGREAVKAVLIAQPQLYQDIAELIHEKLQAIAAEKAKKAEAKLAALAITTNVATVPVPVPELPKAEPDEA